MSRRETGPGGGAMRPAAGEPPVRQGNRPRINACGPVAVWPMPPRNGNMLAMQGTEGLKYDAAGLIPAIIQDADTNEVLMMAYMNKDSLADTIRTRRTHFWSRSRQKYWMKGESSGHVQEVVGVYIDCDRDTLLIKVRQTGAACHEGYRSCFFRRLQDDGEWTVIAERLFDPGKVYGTK